MEYKQQDAPKTKKKPKTAQDKTEIVNLYAKIPKKFVKENKKHNPNEFAPQHCFRMCIIGSSGAGKTNLACNLIQQCACFETVCLIAKNIDQPVYKFLKEKLKDSFIASDKLADIPKVKDEPWTKDVEIYEPEIFPSDMQKLMIFDDLVGESAKDQKKIAEFFLWSRQKNWSVIYIAQNYYQIPKMVRANCSHMILKSIRSTKDLDRILSEYKSDVPKEVVRECYKEASEDKSDFLMIEFEPVVRFRKGLRFEFDLSQYTE